MIVRAPATSANIGAGFDTAAVALDLWNELEVTDGSGVIVEGEGAAELSLDADNLAVRAYALLADPAGKRFRFRNAIPLERGLGSSAAAIALGLVAAAPGGEPRGAARGRPDARTACRQPRGGAPRRPDPRLGREDRPDRGDAPARRDRHHPELPNVDQDVARSPAGNGPARRGGRERRAGCPARCGSGERRCNAVRSGTRRLAPRALPPVRGARRRPANSAARAASGRRSRARARP